MQLDPAVHLTAKPPCTLWLHEHSRSGSKVFFLHSFPLASTRSCISGKQPHFLAAFMIWNEGSTIGLTLSSSLENEIK